MPVINLPQSDLLDDWTDLRRNVPIRREGELLGIGADSRIIDGYRYWQRITPSGAAFPGRQHFEPTDVPGLLRYIVLIDVEYPGPRFRYRVFSSEWRDAVSRDLTGLYLDDPSIRDLTHTSEFHYKYLISKRLPTFRMGQPSLGDLPDYPRMQRLYMPMARDGASIDQVLGVSVVPHRLAG